MDYLHNLLSHWEAEPQRLKIHPENSALSPSRAGPAAHTSEGGCSGVTPVILIVEQVGAEHENVTAAYVRWARAGIFNTYHGTPTLGPLSVFWV